MPTTELQPVVIRTDGSRSDDQRPVGHRPRGHAQTAGLLFHDLPRRWRPDEHTDDAEKQRDDDHFRDQRANEMVAPTLHPLLCLSDAQFARDDGEVERAEREQGHDQNQLQDERLPVWGSGEGREVADLEPCGVETGEPHNAPGDQRQQRKARQSAT